MRLLLAKKDSYSVLGTTYLLVSNLCIHLKINFLEVVQDLHLTVFVCMLCLDFNLNLERIKRKNRLSIKMQIMDGCFTS